MRTKQILIEKYIEPSETGNKITCYIIERWFDKYGDRHSFMGHPSVIYYKGEKIVRQYWHKKDIIHRDRNLPAYIEYYEGEISLSKYYCKYNILFNNMQIFMEKFFFHTIYN